MTIGPRCRPRSGVCLGALFGALATASYLSAAMPYAQPQSRKSLFASSVPGQKGRTFAASLGMIGGAILIALPAVIAAVLSLDRQPGMGLGGTRPRPGGRRRWRSWSRPG